MQIHDLKVGDKISLFVFGNELFCIAPLGVTESEPLDFSIRGIDLARNQITIDLQDQKIYGTLLADEKGPFKGVVLSFDDIKRFNIPIKQYKKEQENIMSNPGAAQTFTSDLAASGYRVAARQITQATRNMVLQLLKSHGVKKSQLKAVSEILETEWGAAAIGVALGWALRYMPGLKEDPRVQHLAKEFRVDGMATAGDLLCDEAFGTFLPVLMKQIGALPEPSKVRVDTSMLEPKKETSPLTIEVDETAVGRKSQNA